MRKEIYFFIGTTAELIKLGAVLNEFNRRNTPIKIITSGQNKINFNDFEFLTGKQTVYHNLRLKPIKLPVYLYFRFVIWTIKAFVNHLLYFRKEFTNLNKKDSFFIVHGDTVSSLIGAVIAKIYGVRLVHIESGLRSYNFFEPFPEELCRFITSHLTDIHFCPNSWSLNNLKDYSGIKINTGQNTSYESCVKALQVKKSSNYFKKVSKDKFFLLIIHRQEHMLYKKSLTKKYIDTLTSIANQNLKCVFILHRLTEKFLIDENLLNKIKSNPNIITFPRIPYFEFMKILSKSEFIATDGGSNQEEAYYLGKPCLILRGCTEQIEGLESNAVLAKDDMNIVKDFLKNYKTKNSKKIVTNTLPSKIIVDYLLNN